MAKSGGLFDFIRSKINGGRVSFESLAGYDQTRSIGSLGPDDFVTKSQIQVQNPGVIVAINTYPFTISNFSTEYPQFPVPCFFLREYVGTEKVPVNTDQIRYDTATDILTIDRGFAFTGDLTIFQP